MASLPPPLTKNVRNVAQAMHASLVVDKPARDLLGVLLAELDDIDTDHVPLVVDSILSPLLRASRQRPGSTAIGEVTDGGMGEAAATGFLIALELLPKVLGLTAGVAALGQAPPVPELVQGLSGTQYKERIVLRLFRAHWPGSVSIGICQALRDLDLGERQLRVAVDRVLRHLRKRAELHDLPPLTYQLLLLAGRCEAHAAQLVAKMRTISWFVTARVCVVALLESSVCSAFLALKLETAQHQRLPVSYPYVVIPVLSVAFCG